MSLAHLEEQLEACAVDCRADAVREKQRGNLHTAGTLWNIANRAEKILAMDHTEERIRELGVAKLQLSINLPHARKRDEQGKI